MPYLIIETGKNKGKRVKLPEGESVVGRDEKAGLRIASNDVSRLHCLLIAKPEGLFVRDLGSSNGTYVNGATISVETELKPGDLLMIGPMGFRVEGRLPGLSGGRKPVRPQGAVPDQGLSDDEIATLLTEGSDETVVSSDTSELTAATPPTQQPPIQIQPKKRPFKTTAEEAADIIRRHKEALAARSGSSGSGK